jgi:hypothetical protein
MKHAVLFAALSAGAFGEAPYAGSAACASCHREQFATQPATPMGRALERAADCAILRTHPRLTFKEGAYSTTISREGEKSFYSVTDGARTIRVPLEWAFGLGVAGQTYALEYQGQWYESRVSFYNEAAGLDLTMGAQGYQPHSLEEAFGRKMSIRDKHDCFACHSTSGTEGMEVQFDKIATGIQCENCHGPAAAHVSSHAPMPKLDKLGPEEMSEACGRCHRTWSQIALDGPRDIRNVRFQPYRLTNSKCYDSADARIRCTACHDPHRTVETKSSAYDAKCLACHGGNSQPSVAKHCKLATDNCSSCHMPKLELPGAHHKFTDHNIRIVRAHEPYPG